MYTNLKLQIWRLGIRQNRLAQMLGVDETLLSRIMNGLREPSPELKARIANVVGGDEDWLFLQDTGPLGLSGGDGQGKMPSRKRPA